MESIDMFLIDPVSGAQFQFPVNPEKLSTRGEAELETVQLARIGEVDWFAGNKRTVITWNSFFPGRYDPHYCRYVAIPNPVEARDRLVAWRVAGTVLRLIVTGLERGKRVDVINAPVLMAVFSPDLIGGQPNDIYYEITLRQYREVQIRTEAEAGASTSRLDLAPVPGKYTVKDGDTLWLIAKTQLGSGERWPEIYALNKDVIGPDPNLIQIGVVLALPGAGAPPTSVPPAVATEETPRYTATELTRFARNTPQ